ncbi:eukaryotic translation initiation factor 2 subunit beta-like [Papaver somniferum]|uniref:eukaryotic translation initiation factor 2 subunit beta-like n=1 Tax=Papaver somniferum TaxID=3469 RepID=UPI000E700666|nr:eukaryotic translation initiation factor 2 subunit beta-like [Papaver somniferum]
MFSMFWWSKKKKKKPLKLDFVSADALHDQVKKNEGETMLEIVCHVFEIPPYIPQVQVLRKGFRKTVFANFMSICTWMQWEPEHLMNFLLTEMGTSGCLDGQQRLVVKGRFTPEDFQRILQRYLKR